MAANANAIGIANTTAIAANITATVTNTNATATTIRLLRGLIANSDHTTTIYFP